MSELLANDPNSRVSRDDERFGDILPSADKEEAEPTDEHDYSDREVYHGDAMATIDRIRDMPKVSVDLGARATGLVNILTTLSEISKLRGFLKGGEPRQPPAVDKKIERLVEKVNAEILRSTGLNELVEAGELTSLDATDEVVQIRYGLRTTYGGADNAGAREKYIKRLKSK